MDSEYPQSLKPLILLSAIPLPQLNFIKNIILTEEGGWSLEDSSTGGHDGGWTYGGMTSLKFSEYFGVFKTFDLFNIFLGAGDDNKQWAKETIIRIMYQDYCVSINQAHLQSFDTLPEQHHISCSINCGPGTAAQLIRNSAGSQYSKVVTPRKAFLTEWKNHYFTIRKNNPAYADQFFDGWINRIWNYVL